MNEMYTWLGRQPFGELWVCFLYSLIVQDAKKFRARLLSLVIELVKKVAYELAWVSDGFNSFVLAVSYNFLWMYML